MGSQKGGLTRRPVASISSPAVAAIDFSMAAILPPARPISKPCRPSGRFALRMIRSNMGQSSDLALAAPVGCISACGTRRAGHERQRCDRHQIGNHQEDLIGDDAAQPRLQAQLEAVEQCKQQRSDEGAAGPPGGEDDERYADQPRPCTMVGKKLLKAESVRKAPPMPISALPTTTEPKRIAIGLMPCASAACGFSPSCGSQA